MIINKKNFPYNELCPLSRLPSENQRRWKERQVLWLCQRAKKAVKHEGDGDNSCNRHTWNGPQRLEKEVGSDENWRTHWDHSNYCIVVISQNTEKSPGDLKKFAVTWTPVKDHQLMPIWKTCKERNNNDNNICLSQNSLQRLGKEVGRVGNQKTSKDHPNCSFTKIGQNTEKGLGDLRRLAVT